jgi:hypothetical protein
VEQWQNTSNNRLGRGKAWDIGGNCQADRWGRIFVHSFPDPTLSRRKTYILQTCHEASDTALTLVGLHQEFPVGFLQFVRCVSCVVHSAGR